MILFLDGLSAIFILWLGILGFKQGLVEGLGRLLGLILSAMTAMRYYVVLAGNIPLWLEIDAWVLLLTSFMVIFLFILLIMRVLTRMVNFLIVSKGTRWINRSTGFVFGLLKGSIVVSLIVLFLDISPKDEWSIIVYKESRLARILTHARINIIKIFHWEDPFEKGENFIKTMMETDKEINQ